jgi:hypothetical protein
MVTAENRKEFVTRVQKNAAVWRFLRRIGLKRAKVMPNFKSRLCFRFWVVLRAVRVGAHPQDLTTVIKVGEMESRPASRILRRARWSLVRGNKGSDGCAP